VGQIEDAERLQRAMTISGQPGEVWPETLKVLNHLLDERPPGLDEPAARACADDLALWP
jgi:hypothetical protein